MQFCQVQSEQGRHIPTFFSAWYLVCCILEFVLDKSKLPTTISSKYFQLLIFERISCIHRTVSYSIRTKKEFNGWNFWTYKFYVGEASENLSTKNIDTPAQEKRFVVQLNSAPKNVSKTQDEIRKYCKYGHGHYSKLHLRID